MVFLRLLLVILIVRAVWRLLKGIIEGVLAPGRRSGPPERTVPLVRDPVCGTFVVPSRALAVTSGGETRYFCSEQCRDAYGKPTH